MGPSAAPGIPQGTYFLSPDNFIANLDFYAIQVTILSFHPHTMINHYQITITTIMTGKLDPTIGSRNHWTPFTINDIKATVEFPLAGKR